METYKTKVKVSESGRLDLPDMPFKPGAEVEVVVFETSADRAERVANWTKLVEDIRSKPGFLELTEEEIAEEIAAVRAERAQRG